MRPALLAASKHDSAFLRHYANLYVSTQVAGIRRLSDLSKGTASLVRLLDAISRSPDVVTADRAASVAQEANPHIDAHWLEEIGGDFRRRWAEPGTDHIDGARVKADRVRFAAAAKKAKAFADNAIAHRHDGVFEGTLTYAEIDEAIDCAGLLLRRYEDILNGSHLAALEPVFQGDWMGPLRGALFSAEHRAPEPQHLDSAPSWHDE